MLLATRKTSTQRLNSFRPADSSVSVRGNTTAFLCSVSLLQPRHRIQNPPRLFIQPGQEACFLNVYFWRESRPLDSHSYLRVFGAQQQAAEPRSCFDIPPSFPRKTVWKVRFQSRHQPQRAKAGVDYPSHPARPQPMWTLTVCSSTLTLLQLSDTHRNRCFHSWQREEQAHYIFCKIALIKTVAHTVFSERY